MRKFLSVILLVIVTVVCATAQTTRVRGTVIDAATGSPLPFAAAYFLDSDTGTTSDEQGLFILSTTDMHLRFVKVQMLGYKTVTIQVKPGTYLETEVMLFPQHNRLDAVTVRPDNEKAKRLLAAIDSLRERNNPDRREAYTCDTYTKMEVGLSQPRQLLSGKQAKRQWKFIYDYIDTSEVNGIEYLPVLVTETMARRSHMLDPDSDTENITAARLTGSEQIDQIVGQYTGSMHVRGNFYEPFLHVHNVQIPSPVNAAGLMYYDYYIVDSLAVDSRKTLLVHYHPKQFASHLSFDGEMLIDAEDFAIRRITGKSQGGLGINWIKDIRMESDYQRTPDGRWFFLKDKLYADLSVIASDSTNYFSVPVTRTIEFSNPSFERDSAWTSPASVTVEPTAYSKDESFWAASRPTPLSKREQDACIMVAKVQETKLYQNWYDVVAMLVNGYYDVGPVGFGPILKTFSYNPLEGFRISAGMHTTAAMSKSDRLTGYVAFGCKDLRPKGGLSWEHLFSRVPTTRKLTLDAHYDVLQLGKGFSDLGDGNILSSALGDGWRARLSKVAEGSILYDHEFNQKVNTAWQVKYRHYFPTPFVPLPEPMPTLTASAVVRLSWEESVLRGQFVKTYSRTLYPVLTLSLDGGAAMLQGTYYPFAKPELALDWKAPVPVVGITTLHFDAGTIVGKVPYPLLHFHAGNSTYLRNANAFSTMDYMEFASDTWTTLRFEHNFMGLLLGRIPYIKKLNWREVVTVNAAWGYLSDRNRGLVGLYAPGQEPIPGQPAPAAAIPGMSAMGNVPFVEAGFGITNIFRILRMDFIWRCTHRDDPRPDPRNFMFNLGLELSF